MVGTAKALTAQATPIVRFHVLGIAQPTQPCLAVGKPLPMLGLLPESFLFALLWLLGPRLPCAAGPLRRLLWRLGQDRLKARRKRNGEDAFHAESLGNWPPLACYVDANQAGRAAGGQQICSEQASGVRVNWK